jgi:hypothetical protein
MRCENSLARIVPQDNARSERRVGPQIFFHENQGKSYWKLRSAALSSV